MVFLGSHLTKALSLLVFLSFAPPATAPPSAIDLGKRSDVSATSTVTIPTSTQTHLETTTVSFVTATTTVAFVTATATGDCPNPCGHNGWLCCAAGQICYTDANNQAQCTTSPSPPACSNPCGYYGQLCCSSTEVCSTDTNNQPQCVPPSSGCSTWSTSTYTSTSSYQTTSTYVVTFTRVETGVQTIIGTASWCQEPPICSPSSPPSCNYSLGETPCGDICCVSGQYCSSLGQCVAAGGAGSPGGSGYYSYFTTTYVQTDLQTITLTSSTFVGTDGGSYYSTVTASAPLRPTSETTHV